MSPARMLSHESEARRTNVLLKTIRKEVGGVAEGLSGLTSRVGSMELAIKELDERVVRMEPILNTLAKDMKALTNRVERVETDVGDIKRRLNGTRPAPAS